MKIFIPFQVSETGGTSTFAKKFKYGLEKRGHEVFFTFQKDYDILFVIVQCNPLYLLHAKLRNKKIIQRLDGVYYWSVAKWKYPLLNLAPRIIHAFFADHTVYQSEYSKYCAAKFLGRKKDEQYSIIYNGVDTEFFSSAGEKIQNLRDNPEQKIFITASKFRRYDQILPLIQAMERYREEYTENCKLLIIGDFNREVTGIPSRFRKFTHLQFLGKIGNEDLPKYERSSDVFLMTHLNPPCPNNILEAMGCGLPICGVNDGAMSEITAPHENSLLLETTGDAFWKRREYDTRQFAANLHAITADLPSYSTKSEKMARERFSLDEMIDNYLKILY
jgi:glycosyltransferase involved in cell wall biosynthesis